MRCSASRHEGVRHRGRIALHETRAACKRPPIIVAMPVRRARAPCAAGGRPNQSAPQAAGPTNQRRRRPAHASAPRSAAHFANVEPAPLANWAIGPHGVAKGRTHGPYRASPRSFGPGSDHGNHDAVVAGRRARFRCRVRPTCRATERGWSEQKLGGRHPLLSSSSSSEALRRGAPHSESPPRHGSGATGEKSREKVTAEPRTHEARAKPRRAGASAQR
jgi:hypothetical protein